MLAHGLFRRSQIVLANGVQYPTMTHERLLQPAFQLQRALARFPQQVHKRVQDLQNDAIPGGLSYGVVEFRILFDSQLTLIDPLFLAAQDVFHIRHFFLGSILGGTIGESRFDHASKLEEIADEFALPEKHGSERVDQRLGRGVTNYSSLALAWFDKAHELESANRVTQRAAADLQHFRQFAFRRQFFTGFNEAVADHPLQLESGLFVDLGSPDDFEFGFS